MICDNGIASVDFGTDRLNNLFLGYLSLYGDTNKAYYSTLEHMDATDIVASNIYESDSDIESFDMTAAKLGSGLSNRLISDRYTPLMQRDAVDFALSSFITAYELELNLARKTKGIESIQPNLIQLFKRAYREIHNKYDTLNRYLISNKDHDGELTDDKREQYAYRAIEIKAILDDWGHTSESFSDYNYGFAKLLYAKLQLLGFKFNGVAEETRIEGEDSLYEKMKFEDGAALTENPFDSVSKEFKLMLATLPEYRYSTETKTYGIVLSHLGRARFMNVQSVSTGLYEDLADVYPTIENFIEQLEKRSEYRPYYKTLIDKLNENRNGALTPKAHTLRHQLLRFYGKSRQVYMTTKMEVFNTVTRVKSFRTGSDDQVRTIINRWSEAFKVSDIVSVINGELSINETVRNELVKLYTDYHNYIKNNIKDVGSRTALMSREAHYIKAQKFAEKTVEEAKKILNRFNIILGDNVVYMMTKNIADDIVSGRGTDKIDLLFGDSKVGLIKGLLDVTDTDLSERELLSKKELAQDEGTESAEAPDISFYAFNPFFQKDTKIRLGKLANAIKDFETIFVSPTVSTAEGEKRFIYQNYNHDTLLLAKWKKDRNDSAAIEIYKDRMESIANSSIARKLKNPFSKYSMYLNNIAQDPRSPTGLFDIVYFDGVVARDKDGLPRQKLNDSDNLIVMLSLYFKSGYRQRDSGLDDFFYSLLPTKSDKPSTDLLRSVNTLRMEKSGSVSAYGYDRATKSVYLSKDTYRKYLAPILLGELERALALKRSTLDKNKHIISEEASKIIFTLSQEGINDIPVIQNIINDPSITELTEDIIDEVLSSTMPLMQNHLNKELNKILSDTVAEKVLNGPDMFGAGFKTNPKILDELVEFLINSEASMSEYMMLFGGDYALHFKSVKKGGKLNISASITKTLGEVEKRLAKNVAPRTVGLTDNSPMRMVTVKRGSVASNSFSEYVARGLGQVYGKYDPADGHELITVKEKLRRLLSENIISKEAYDEINKIVDEGKGGYYTIPEKYKFYFQSDKPVTVGSAQSVYVNGVKKDALDHYGYETVVYRKSSSFTLLPEVTVDSNLDNVRIAMERMDVDSFGYDSTDKLLAHKAETIIDNNKKEFVGVDDIVKAFENSMFEVDRLSKGDQQQVPMKDMLILYGSQMHRLILTNTNINNFSFKGEVYGKRELMDKLRTLRNRIHDYAFFDYMKDMGFQFEAVGGTTEANQYFNTRFKSVKTLEEQEALLKEASDLSIYTKLTLGNINKQQQRLITEALTRGYSTYDIDSLKIIQEDGKSKFAIPLGLLQNSEGMQKLLLSIIGNKVVKQKTFGKAFVQVPALGLKNIGQFNNMVFTDGFDPDKGLQSMRTVFKKSENGVVKEYSWDEVIKDSSDQKKFLKAEQDFSKSKLIEFVYDGYLVEVKPAQIVVPFYIKGQDGKYLSLADYTIIKNGKKYLDMDKIDPDLLKGLSYRIPTQQQSSMLPVEIVGFMDHRMGSAAFVPSEIVPQMGADFDLDKIYTYLNKFVVYNTSIRRHDKLSENEYNTINTQQSYQISVAKAQIAELSDLADELNRFMMDIENLRFGSTIQAILAKPQYQNLLASSFFNKLTTKPNGGKDYTNLKTLKNGYVNLINSINLLRTKEKEYTSARRNTKFPSKKDLLNQEYDDLNRAITLHPAMINYIMKPLDMDDLKKESDKRSDRRQLDSFTSTSRHITDFQEQYAGKSLVGMFSLGVVGEAMFQNYRSALAVRIPTDQGFAQAYLKIPVKIYNKSGREVTVHLDIVGSNSSSYSLNTSANEAALALLNDTTSDNTTKKVVRRTKTDNIIMYQSAAVDNAKETILKYINTNTYNANVILGMLLSAGQYNGEDLSMGVGWSTALINQPFAVEHTRTLKAFSSALTPILFIPNLSKSQEETFKSLSFDDKKMMYTMYNKMASKVDNLVKDLQLQLFNIESSNANPVQEVKDEIASFKKQIEDLNKVKVGMANYIVNEYRNKVANILIDQSLDTTIIDPKSQSELEATERNVELSEDQTIQQVVKQLEKELNDDINVAKYYKVFEFVGTSALHVRKIAQFDYKSGIGTSFSELINFYTEREKELDKYVKNKTWEGVKVPLEIYTNTEDSHLEDLARNTFIDLYLRESKQFYNFSSAFETAKAYLSAIYNRDISNNEKIMEKFGRDFKAYIYQNSNIWNGLSVRQEQLRLTKGIYRFEKEGTEYVQKIVEESLAIRISKLKLDPDYLDNEALLLLDTRISTNTINPDKVLFLGGLGADSDINGDNFILGLSKLLLDTNPENRKIGEDIIRYAYFVHGNVQTYGAYARLFNLSFLENYGVDYNLRQINLNFNNPNSISPKPVPTEFSSLYLRLNQGLLPIYNRIDEDFNSNLSNEFAPNRSRVELLEEKKQRIYNNTNGLFLSLTSTPIISEGKYKLSLNKVVKRFAVKPQLLITVEPNKNIIVANIQTNESYEIDRANLRSELSDLSDFEYTLLENPPQLMSYVAYSSVSEDNAITSFEVQGKTIPMNTNEEGMDIDPIKFAIMFARHNPSLIPTIKAELSEEILNSNVLYMTDVEEGLRGRNMPMFKILITDSETNKSTQYIYVRVGLDTPVYLKVSTLGYGEKAASGILEYANAQAFSKSIVEKTLGYDDDNNILEIEQDLLDASKKSISNKAIMSDAYKLMNGSISHKGVMDALGKISKDSNLSQHLRYLSQLLLGYYKNKPLDLNIDFMDSDNSIGQYDRTLNTLSLDVKAKGNTLKMTFAHELLHALTINVIQKVQDGTIKDSAIVEAVNAIQSLYDEYISTLDPKIRSEFNEAMDKLNNSKAALLPTELEGKEIYYAAYNIFEFISNGLTNSVVISHLDTISTEERAGSFLEEVRKFLQKLWQAIFRPKSATIYSELVASVYLALEGNAKIRESVRENIIDSVYNKLGNKYLQGKDLILRALELTDNTSNKNVKYYYDNYPEIYNNFKLIGLPSEEFAKLRYPVGDKMFMFNPANSEMYFNAGTNSRITPEKYILMLEKISIYQIVNKINLDPRYKKELLTLLSESEVFAKEHLSLTTETKNKNSMSSKEFFAKVRNIELNVPAVRLFYYIQGNKDANTKYKKLLESFGTREPIPQKRSEKAYKPDYTSIDQLTIIGGGAYGVDEVGHLKAEASKIKSIQYYIHDDPKKPPFATESGKITDEKYIEKARAFVLSAYNKMWESQDGKGLTNISDKRLIRNYAQVDNSDAVFAFSQIVTKGSPHKVDLNKKTEDQRTSKKTVVWGGTGYAVEMGIMRRKPVYVFDTAKLTWFKWDYDTETFTPINRPKLRKRSAIIGTRDITTDTNMPIAQKTAIESEITGLVDDAISYINNLPQNNPQAITSDFPVGWARYDKNGYEVSSKGETDLQKSFSALNAKLEDGRTIEEAYQLDIKGYRSKGNTSDLGKNELPIVPYYKGLIKPEPNTIFVFGSNPEGRHGAGSAKLAVDKFGAIYGQGEGLQGNAYALPTKDLRVTENNGSKSISPSEIAKSIQKLYETARANPDKKFKIAYTNTTEISLNGYTGLEMIEMFNSVQPRPTNIIFSEEWVNTGKLNIISPEQSWKQYKDLWKQYIIENPDLYVQLVLASKGKVLTDQFATTTTNQARALFEIIDEWGYEIKGIDKNEQPITIDSSSFASENVTKSQSQPVEDSAYWDSVMNSGPPVEQDFSNFTPPVESTEQVEDFTEYQIIRSNEAAFELERIKLEIAGVPVLSPQGFEYNAEQVLAIREATRYLSSEDDSSHWMIQGKAGTGKTSIINEVISKFPKKRVLVMAYTHTATNELKNKIQAKNVEIETVFSGLGLLPDKNGGFKVNTKKQYIPVYDADIIIIDEASMIDDDIIQYINENKPKNVRVLTLGDIGQLQPVRTKTENKYTNRKSSLFNTRNKSILNERVRQGEGSPILDFSDLFWTSAPTNAVAKPKSFDSIINKKGAVIFTDTLQPSILDEFRKAEANDDNNRIRIITYHRDMARRYNDLVRSYLKPNHKDNHLIVGEKVVLDGHIIRDNKVIFNNQQVVKIEQSGRILYVNSDFTITASPKDENTLFLAKELVISDMEKSYPIVALIPSEENMRKRESKEVKVAIDAGWNKLKQLVKGSKDYVELVRKLGAISDMSNLYYTYAATSYRSQSKTIDIVIGDYADHDSRVSPTSRAESLYTIITRARNVVVMYTGLAKDESQIDLTRLSNDIDKNKEDDSASAISESNVFANYYNDPSEYSAIPQEVEDEINREISNIPVKESRVVGIIPANIEFEITPFGKSIDNIDISKSGVNIGYVQISKNDTTKTLTVTGIELKQKGFGKNVYLKLQRQYPEFTIKSDSTALTFDAINMWDSLVSRGLATKQGEKQYTLNKFLDGQNTKPANYSLNTTVGNIMNDISKTERIELRNMINNSEVTFQCK
jgi:hypothetical protein